MRAMSQIPPSPSSPATTAVASQYPADRTPLYPSRLTTAGDSVTISTSDSSLVRSHPDVVAVHRYEPTGQENVTDGRGRLAGRTVRGAAGPSAGGRLPDARLARRS